MLHEIVASLVDRPGHEKVRTLVTDLLVHGLGAAITDVQLERAVPEVSGRLDGLLGRTVFEFKRNLRIERKDAETQLLRYLEDRQRETGEHFVGITTDGAAFWVYELQKGALERIGEYVPDRNKPRELLVWLDGAIALDHEIAPEPEAVRIELGRGSLTYHMARARLQAAWDAVKDVPDVQLKRRLWADLLARVYGTRIEADDLFLQHTYLTIVAKTMASSVLGIADQEPADLLSGRRFQEAGILGAVESDFFDWVLEAPGHDDLIRRIERQVGRFRLRDVQHDVMKVLYESLIDPETRHDLGEYYTPDWLAELMCERVIDRPLEQRVLDPSCGSGTFLFHGVRRYLAAAAAAGLSPAEQLSGCCNHVFGVDVHPVAAIIARVTYLMALGPDLLTSPGRPQVSLPVYVGDSLQWNVETVMTGRSVEIPAEGKIVRFPQSVTAEIATFETVLQGMLDHARTSAQSGAFRAWLERVPGVDAGDHDALVATYADLEWLYQHDRDGIWGYVARNLSRPLWLSTPEHRPDVLIGNPPWLSYRFMDKATQDRFKRESERRGVWAGGRFATHQDLSGYFFARSAELYLNGGGRMAFVMPFASMSRGQFAGFRKGWFAGGPSSQPLERFATVRFEEGWTFDESVQPLFPVPCCVLIARLTETGPLPATVTAYQGHLEQRDAPLTTALERLRSSTDPWPSDVNTDTAASPYKAKFLNGATVFPRMMFLIERLAAGRLGTSASTPAVRSHRSNQEKPPWKTLPGLEGMVESVFLRSLYLGESIAPFRLLQPQESVIPWDGQSLVLLDEAHAAAKGYVHLAQWLRQLELLWRERSSGRMTLLEQLDYFGKLTAQLPPAPLRVVYGASGSLLAAAVLGESQGVCEHSLYWAEVNTRAEAQYLTAILNSETLRARIEKLQATGQWGTRHFDKYVFEAPIPRFNPRDALHKELAAKAEHAETVAAAVPLKLDEHFTRTRGRIRDALKADGVSCDIDALVARLLG